jgi:hypothetical protein
MITGSTSIEFEEPSLYILLRDHREGGLLDSPREWAFEPQYKAAAAEGALYELRMRLLADKVPALQQAAYGERLEDVEGLIIVHFAGHLTDQEKSLLKLCRQLRNKILHCDFHAARKKLGELGANPQQGNVKRIDIRGLSGRAVIAKISDVTANVVGTFQYVGASPTGAGAVLAWLIEAGVAGDFTEAAKSFARAAQIIDHLAMSEA